MNESSCPFCPPQEDLVFFQGDLVRAVWDKYPVSDGHALIIPHRHVASWFEATPEEQAELFQVIDSVKNEIETQYDPLGFNIGINVGQAAGQTVPHLHVHIIPRYEGDVADPGGGIRNVVPDQSGYLEIIPIPSVGGSL